MQIVMEKVDLPQKGHVEFGFHRSFEITITHEQARTQVKRWLWSEVSMLLSAEPPALVIDTVIVWRVPVRLIAPGYGALGTVGFVDVNVQTGELLDLEQKKVLIEAQAAQLTARLPDFQPSQAVYAPAIPTQLPTAMSVSLPGE